MIYKGRLFAIKGADDTSTESKSFNKHYLYQVACGIICYT